MHSIVCCADGLLVNKHKAHESALRAFILLCRYVTGLVNPVLRTLLSAAQTACSLLSTKLTNPRCALCILLRRICDRTRDPRATHSIVCCADGSLVNKHKAHESALRALHPATQDIRSLITQEKQMPALLALVFLLRSLHYIITRGYVLYKIVFYLKWLTV